MRSTNKPRTSTILFLLAALSFLFAGCGLLSLVGIHPEYSSRDLLSNRDFRWLRDSSASCNIYYEAGSWAERNPAYLRANADSSTAHVLRMIGEPRFDRRLNYFIVSSRQRMRELVGEELNAVAFPGDFVLCAVANDSLKAIGVHEIFHLITMSAWGSTETWINEGMAVYSDDRWWGVDLHTLAHYLQTNGKLPSLDDLSEHFGGGNVLITYPASGSLMKFLYETYGRENVKILWQNGLDAFCEAVHKSKADLAHDWLDRIGREDTGKVHYRIP